MCSTMSLELDEGNGSRCSRTVRSYIFNDKRTAANNTADERNARGAADRYDVIRVMEVPRSAALPV